MADSNRSALMDWTAEDDPGAPTTRTGRAIGSNWYDFFQPGYRYGYESANRHQGRTWDEVESDLCARAGIGSSTAARARGNK